jgi:hypothetical protein
LEWVAAFARNPRPTSSEYAPKAEIERQEQIKEAMEYRLIGYTYRQIADAPVLWPDEPVPASPVL